MLLLKLSLLIDLFQIDRVVTNRKEKKCATQRSFVRIALIRFFHSYHYAAVPPPSSGRRWWWDSSSPFPKAPCIAKSVLVNSWPSLSPSYAILLIFLPIIPSGSVSPFSSTMWAVFLISFFTYSCFDWWNRILWFCFEFLGSHFLVAFFWLILNTLEFIAITIDSVIIPIRSSNSPTPT